MAGLAKTPSPAADQVATLDGSVTIDPDTMYRLELGFAIRHVGVWFRPSDKNVRLRGDVLLAVAATAKEGTFLHVTPVS